MDLEILWRSVRPLARDKGIVGTFAYYQDNNYPKHETALIQYWIRLICPEVLDVPAQPPPQYQEAGCIEQRGAERRVTKNRYVGHWAKFVYVALLINY